MTQAVSGMSAALYQDESLYYVVTALGSNRDLCFVSQNLAVPSIRILVAGNNTALSIGVSGSDVTINSATNGGGAATSTAALILAAMQASAPATALWTVRLPPGQDGSGVTGAMSLAHGADGVTFTSLALTDSGDHLTYQSAAGYRYWSSCSLVEKQVHGAGGWVDITSSVKINLVRGSITIGVALNNDDLVRATGVRRSENAFQKVMNLYDGKTNINGKDIDTSSLDDAGWGSSIVGAKKWVLTCAAFFYSGSLPPSKISARLYTKFYAIYLTGKSFIGIGNIASLDHVLANPNEAQKQTITINGQGEIYPE